MTTIADNLCLLNGINRYIVGCKYAPPNNNNVVNSRINRYIVGCKYINYKLQFRRFFEELIDT